MKYKVINKLAHLDEGNIITEALFTKEFFQPSIIAKLLLDLGYIQEYDPNKKWEPKDGEEYYFIDYDGSVQFTYFYYRYSVDKVRKEIGNCFQTREEAEVMAEKFKALLKQERGTTTD